MVFTIFLWDPQRERLSMKRKLACSLAVSLGKTRNGIPSSLCGRRVARASSILVAVAQCN